MSGSLDTLIEAIIRVQAVDLGREATEEDTRAKIIDSIIDGGLGWHPNQVSREVSIEENRLDYLLNAGGHKLVIEAKRVGCALGLPAGYQAGKMIMTIKAACALSKEASKSIKQCIAYALENNIGSAAVTNGLQWIVFSTRRPAGKNIYDCKCCVFDGGATIISRAAMFWEMMSPPGIEGGAISRVTGSEGVVGRSSSKLEGSKEVDQRLNRSDLQADLALLGDLFFGDAVYEDRRFFQDNCYCASGPLAQFTKATKDIITAQYSDEYKRTVGPLSVGPATNKKGPEEALVNLANLNKPVLLLGDVGVGKTTFIEHLYLVTLADMKDKLIIIRIDFGVRPSSVEEIPKMISEEIRAQLYNNYSIDIYEDRIVRGVLDDDIVGFGRGVYGPLRDSDLGKFKEYEIDFIARKASEVTYYYSRMFRHLTVGRGKRVVIIFDNMDQRTQEMQRQAFVQAQICASNYNTAVIIALRPETFSKTNLSSELSGYHPKAFTISPPRFDLVLEKRLQTAMDIFSGKLNCPRGGASLHYKSVAVMLKVLEDTNRNDKGKEIAAFCQDMSNGSTRLALDYINVFISSPHTDSVKILLHAEERRGYRVPFHEFLRSIIYGDRKYYISEKSHIPNLFSYPGGGPEHVLINLAALHCVHVAMSVEKRLVLIDNIVECLSSLGYSQDGISASIRFLTEKKFIENERKLCGMDGGVSVRITTSGNYMLNFLCEQVSYLEAVSLDTPIDDSSIHSSLTLDTGRLEHRLNNAEMFVRYLDGVCARPSVVGIARHVQYDLWRAKVVKNIREVYGRIGGRSLL